MKIPQISENDYDFVDSTLAKYGNEYSIQDCSELDGFLTAIVSGPGMIMPSTWMPAIWGGEDLSPEWETAEEFQRFAEVVMAMMNRSSVVLMEAPEQYEALFSEVEVDGELNLIVTDWCYGYMLAVEMQPQAWITMPESVGMHFGRIALFGSDEAFDQFSAMDDRELDTIREELEPAVRAIHAYWLEQRS